jgi:hypothetical protein
VKSEITYTLTCFGGAVIDSTPKTSHGNRHNRMQLPKIKITYTLHTQFIGFCGLYVLKATQPLIITDDSSADEWYVWLFLAVLAYLYFHRKRRESWRSHITVQISSSKIYPSRTVRNEASFQRKRPWQNISHILLYSM